MDTCFNIYATNDKNKPCRFTISFELCKNSFPKTGAKRCLKKNLEYESILYNSTELSVDWTSREFQNQTILFSRKIKSFI